MNENTLMKVCFIGSILSILFLYILSFNIHYSAYVISDINENMLGRTVNVSGVITDVYSHKNGHIFLTIRDDTGTIKIVLWDRIVDALSSKGINASSFKKGARIQVVGDVNIYKGELEIIPSKPDVKLLT